MDVGMQVATLNAAVYRGPHKKYINIIDRYTRWSKM